MYREPASSRTRVTVAVAASAVLLAGSVLWGRSLLPAGHLNVNAPPFHGFYRLSLSSVVPASVFAAVVIVALPPVAAVLRWRPLLSCCWLLAAGWAVLLNAWDGHRDLGSPISRPHEYLAVLPAVGGDPLLWLRGFTAHLSSYPIHVKGHPPLMVLVFWLWDRAGLGGGLWAAALVIGVGASSVAAVAVTLRVVSDESSARRVLPFLVLAPFAITVATSADAFFAGVAAWSVAAVAIGVRRLAPAWLAAGGLLAGALPYLSYGLLSFGAVPLAAGVLAWRLRRPSLSRWSGTPGRAASAVAATAAGLAVVPVLMTLGGFWWPDGVAATHVAWTAGRGDDRPYLYSFVADLAVLGVLVGPAAVAAAVSRPRRPVAVLTGAALLGVLVLDLSGVTRLEVERIWLPFAPWVLVVCSGPRRGQRGWLAVNALVALAFQAFVRDVW